MTVDEDENGSDEIAIAALRFAELKIGREQREARGMEEGWVRTDCQKGCTWCGKPIPGEGKCKDCQTMCTLCGVLGRGEGRCSAQTTSPVNATYSSNYTNNARLIEAIGGVKFMPKGVGTVRIFAKGRTLDLSNAQYIPGLGVNLISVGQLEESEYKWGNRLGKPFGIWFNIKDWSFTSTNLGNVYILNTKRKFPVMPRRL
jgi:hypothetical protein